MRIFFLFFFLICAPFTFSQDKTVNDTLKTYFENGCIKSEVYLKGTVVKEYDSLVCGKILSSAEEIHSDQQPKLWKIITQFKDGKVVGKTYLNKDGSKNEVTGVFEEDRFISGTVKYYTTMGRLLFENKIVKGERDAILSSGEKQGQQINLVDPNGKKTGLWITEKESKAPIELSSDYTNTYRDAKDFSFFQYEYLKGDTLAQVTLLPIGGIASYYYLKNKEARIRAHQEITLSYYDNGRLRFKGYELENGFTVLVEYADTEENEIIKGRKDDFGILKFKNNRLVEIESHPVEEDVLDAIPWSGASSRRQGATNYCVEKGHFKHFELYNGFIYYYKNKDELRLTEKVVNGVIQGNPRVNFKNEKLQVAALANDLNFNGWVEKREVESTDQMNLHLTKEEIQRFPWYELKRFKSLIVLHINGRIYMLSDYKSNDALKTAVLENKGKSIPPRRYSWQVPDVPMPSEQEMLMKVEPPMQEEIFDIVDLEAHFFDGEDSLSAYLDRTIRIPEEIELPATEIVWVSFVVEKNGSISTVKVLRGTIPELNKEAIRVVRAMPKWMPGEHKGKVVRTLNRLPIRFVPK